MSNPIAEALEAELFICMSNWGYLGGQGVNCKSKRQE